jgi:hypothetical protein
MIAHDAKTVPDPEFPPKSVGTHIRHRRGVPRKLAFNR